MKRITRAALEVEELPPVEVTKLRRNKKKVKFEDLVEVETKITQNLSASMVSDEGIDMTFSPIPESLSTTILKPRHPLPHSWTFCLKPPHCSSRRQNFNVSFFLKAS
jgi:hypothetical protein